MTYADEAEFMPPEGQEEAPNYPTAFGITFTPRIGGIIFGLVGLGVATYLLFNVVQPAWENYQKVESSVKTKQSQVAKKQEIQRQIKEKTAELARVKQQNKQVLSLFANENALDTLLLDLNNPVKRRQGTLLGYQPETEAQRRARSNNQETVANGKLQPKVYNVSLQGTFDEVESIMRSIERLPSVAVIRDFKSEVADDQGLLINPESNRWIPAVFKRDRNNRPVPGGRPDIKTTFKVEALLPMTEEQTMDATTQPAQKPKK